MSVYRPKGSPYYHFDFRFRGRRHHGSTGLTARRDAEAFERRERQAAALGTPARPPISLDEAIGTYVANRLAGRPDHKNALGYARRALAHFGAGTALSSITAADIAAFAARRRAEVSDATTNRDLRFLRRVWNYAVDPLGRDVGEPIRWGRLMYAEPEERVREMTPAEEARLFAHLREDLRDFMAFAMIRGIRQAGLRALRWSDVDLDAGTITYVVKGSRLRPGAPRVKRLTPAEIAILRRQPRAGPFVFTYVCRQSRRSSRRTDGRTIPGRIAGERYPLSASVIQEAMAEARAAAGIADLRFHDATRHTAATRLVRRAKNLKLAQAMLDHRDIKTTAKYAHATEDDLYAAMVDVERTTDPTIGRARRRR